MKDLILPFIIVPLFFLVISCAAPGPLILKSHNEHYSRFSEDKGYVYFYRETRLWQCARGLYIFADGKKIGGLNIGTYFVFEVEPGIHEFYAGDWMRKEKILKLDIQPSKKYFIKGDFRLGIMDVVPYIEQVETNIGTQEIESLTYATRE